MNADALRKVADAIEEGRKDFGYNQYCYGCRDSSTCGTAGCIAGWTVLVTDGKRKLEAIDFSELGSRASEILGLSENEHACLFTGDTPVVATEKSAVRTLRYAAEHGVIDWQAANAEGTT